MGKRVRKGLVGKTFVVEDRELEDVVRQMSSLYIKMVPDKIWFRKNP